MAPLHHHFEKGWYESQVVMRFYILCILCAVVALSTLKLRLKSLRSLAKLLKCSDNKQAGARHWVGPEQLSSQ